MRVPEEKKKDAMTYEELEERKRFFFETIKTKNWGLIIANLVLGLIFAAYFIQVYLYLDYFKSQFKVLKDDIPVYLDRYHENLLGYSFMRERIIFNNNLDSFEIDPIYGHSLDVHNIE